MIPRVGRGGHSPAFRAQVVALIASGQPFRDVAKDLGLSTSTIGAWCKAAGVRGKRAPPMQAVLPEVLAD